MDKLLNYILAGIILILLGISLFNEKPDIKKLNKENKTLSLKYDSLLHAKVKETIKYDTIHDTTFIDNPIPFKEFDTIYLRDTITAKIYKGTIKNSILKLSYEALTFGSLEDIKFTYETYNKTITKETILYIDKPFETKVWYPKRHLYLFGSITSDLKHFSFDAVYNTKKQLAFKAGYMRYEKKSYITAGVGIRIF
jgi:hypothetical protein